MDFCKDIRRMAHEKIFRCHSATFHIDGATYQIVTNDEPANGLKILRKKTPVVVDLSEELTSVSSENVITRLKLLLDKIENESEYAELSPKVLKQNIQYAISIIQEGALANERADESDHELSEVDEEVIPDEVKAWLASTFTKNFPGRLNKTVEPRPRFRSVANAIRVGLFVDRFYRQLSSNTLQIPPEVVSILKEISNWNFDIFKLHTKSNSHSLKFVVKDLFSRYGLFQKFKMNLGKLDNFISAIELGYTKLKNPYHNDIHAADVTQSLHYFIGSSGVVNVLTDLEIFALLFAAIIHDFEHTGRTNNFHINVGTDLALLYNDRSVLENHHVSAAFKLLKDDDMNILSHLSPDDYREFRNLVIEMVLSTDMSTHFTQLKNLRSTLKEGRGSSSSTSRDGCSKTTKTAMCFILHCADISHPGKPWRTHKKLADHILEEFFLQGDEEAKIGLPFSPLCDRASVLVPESQISFIEFIVEPSLALLGELFDFLLREDEHCSLGPIKEHSRVPISKHGRRAESDNQMLLSSAAKNEGGLNAKMLSDGGRTSSFPLQTEGGGKNGGRPWVNHLQENKAKWRMIAAERDRVHDKGTEESTNINKNS